MHHQTEITRASSGRPNGLHQRVESVVNHVELWDTFINTPLTDDDRFREELPQLALALGECWQGVLSRRYPDRGITVHVSDEEDGSYGPTVTLWTSSAECQDPAPT
ncbi:hypothetical protein [Streptomyces sp. BH105]|uniref:hypothetical protein n=1 Tax=Streptomyces sp. BH105 TaxID=3410408 RepID=UPI003CFA7C77